MARPKSLFNEICDEIYSLTDFQRHGLLMFVAGWFENSKHKYMVAKVLEQGLKRVKTLDRTSQPMRRK